MGKRLNITISFAGYEEGYKYIKNHPNGSYYVRELVKQDIEKNKKQKNNINVNNNDIDVNNVVNDILDW